MSVDDAREHWVPGHVRNYLEGHGFRLPLEDMDRTSPNGTAG